MKENFLLSLVVPVYYEQECIAEFINRTTKELENNQYDYEIVFIDDGSKDKTVEIITEHIKTNTRIKLVEFSYNHGKESAVTAGIEYAKGDYLLYMDPDLQDPPDEIVNFVNKIQEGYDLVFGIRKEKVDTFINKIYSAIFWSVLQKLTGLEIPKGISVMRIFNRKFADEFLKYKEANRFIEGIFMQISMKRTQIPVSQKERFAGKSKYNFKRKMTLAFNAIFNYSDVPLKMATRFGMFLIILSFLWAFGLILAKLFFIDFQLGWASLFTILLLGFGTQIFFLGIVGRYIGNIYKEVKRRPLFSVKKLHNI